MITPFKAFSFRSAICLTSFILLVSSCNGAKPNRQEIDFTVVANWQHCPIHNIDETKKKYFVYFDSPATVLNFIRAELPNTELSTSNTSYLLLAYGQKNSGGYGIETSTARLIDTNKLAINAEFTAPKAGQMVTMALTSPCTLLSFNALPSLQEIHIASAKGEQHLSATTPFDAPSAILIPKAAPDTKTINKQPKTHWQP